ncbi:DUF456 domain-containing protein [Selenihalanaerobacter shriftii]|uniref:DUF456 domain-containing protein n=1 Tax=Selenihalanaerobacter shriftii TaxID=142842 RepID=A0A1T4MZA5_9FIRM|nr:DUF456 domain-containing protein [Selenihalanaerobacter shriftii]SJZ72353.1 hypothetical protein SAMN02745118_01657 [Selenihalanaerobacter shriftii]
MIKAIIILMTIVGVLGTLLPVLPGTPIIVITALIYGFINNFQVISVKLIIILTVLSVIGEILEYIISGIGAKKFGASKYGIFGSVVGGLIGMVTFGPVGALGGLLFGGIIIEMILGKPLIPAIKIGLGAVVGALSGTLFSFLIALLMAGLLISRVI